MRAITHSFLLYWYCLQLLGALSDWSLMHGYQVDIFPTLADLAGIPVPPTCATISDSISLPLCTEGRSLAPLVLSPSFTPREKRTTLEVKNERSDDQSVAQGAGAGAGAGKRAAFWQWTKMMIERLPVMGYAMATDDEHDGSYYRYTEWVAYNFTSSKGKGGGIGCETCVLHLCYLAAVAAAHTRIEPVAAAVVFLCETVGGPL